MRRILLTGAAGVIGTSLRNSLGHLYRFRCLDTRYVDGEADAVVGSVRDPDCLAQAMQDMDAVIHLAARAGFDQPWADVYADGIGATYDVFEAARIAGIKRLIYASSTAVLGWTEMQQGQRVSPEMPIHPYRLYGIGKATGELLARYFSETYGMSITCLRIGFFHADPPSPQNLQDLILSAWCSPEDLAQLVQRCLDGDELGFQVYYAVSNNKRSLWDIGNARRLVGYRPVSDAEDLIRPPGNVNTITAPDLHDLLMSAALQDGAAALDSWQTWAERIDFEHAHLDTLSYRLLPLVYSNLADLDLPHPFMNKLKGVYRRAWLENQLALQQVIPFMTQLRERGMAVLALDDLAAILGLYDGQGMRRLYSLDLLVHPADVSKLIGFFAEQKIWPKVSYGERFLAVEQTLDVWPPFDLPLTVAWRVFTSVRTREQAQFTWQRAGTAMLGDCPVSVLDLESQFVRSCLRAVHAGPQPSFFALLDAAWMLRKKADSIDWAKVVELARLDHQVLPVIQCLQRIARIVDTPAANRLLAQLQAEPLSWTDRLEHRWLHQYRTYPGIWVRIARRLLLYRRSIKTSGPLGFFRYIQYAWGAPRLRSIVRLAWRHARAAASYSGA